MVSHWAPFRDAACVRSLPYQPDYLREWSLAEIWNDLDEKYIFRDLMTDVACQYLKPER